MPIILVTPQTLLEAASRLRAGELVAFPTETVYGLGADARNARAVQRIYATKGRPATNPVIVHVLDLAAAESLISAWPPVASRLAAAFWPGPLTLVLPKSAAVPDAITAGGPTVALRAPAHPVARALLQAAQCPVAAPSANASGQISPTTAAHVTASLGDSIFVLDGGPCSGGIESTVVNLAGEMVQLLRPGLISVAELECSLGQRVSVERPAADMLPSPGLLARHYAPRTPLEIAYSPEEMQKLTAYHTAAGARVGGLVFTGTPTEVATRLYAELHAADMAGFDRLVVLMPPGTEEWRAIRDRLTRAAAC